MRTVDAVWEKRNIGVSTLEVTVEPQDTADNIVDKLNNLSAQYQVVKVPTGMIQVMWTLEAMGFHYIETVVNVTYDLNKLTLPNQFRRINDAVEYRQMDVADIDHMFQEVAKGMFFTDRVALDPYFSMEQASNRYVCWLRDEEKRGSAFYKYLYKKKTVGFFAMKEIADKIYYPFLAGIYKEYQSLPIGAVYLYKTLEEARRLGGKSVSTYISLNNSGALRTHVDYGYTFRQSHCVFVKHEGEKC